MLNQYFKTVFTVDGDENQPHKGQSLYPTIANFTQGVYNILNTCNPYKSPGPDGIHPYALRATATEVSPTYANSYIPTVIEYRCACYLHNGNMHMSHPSSRRVQKQIPQTTVLSPLHQLYM